jgi:uncharacterized membrane protein
MNEDWLMTVIGVVLIVLGFTVTRIKQGLFGKPLYPTPMRFRVILISFGVLMIALGLYRVAQH